MDDAQKVEEIFPKVVSLLFNDPTDKLKTIVTFKNNVVSEEHLRNHEKMIPALKHILNTILCKTKVHILSSQEKDKDWREALRYSYNSAVRDGAYPKPKMGSTLEHDIATGLNLDSSSKTRSAVASMSVTQFKIGKQTAALSKAIIADKLDRLEEVLVFRNLDMMSDTGSFNDKLNSVTE